MAMLDTASRPWNKPKTVAPSPKTALAPKTVQPREINNPIDRLAAVRAEKAKLEKEEKELTETVRKLGDGEHDGDKVRAVISTTSPERLDVDAIRAAMPDEWIERFTKSKPQTTVRFKPLV
jgi:hypothetical protein